MTVQDFEAALVGRGFYLESPSVFVPGTNRDTEFYTPTQFLDILSHSSGTGGFVPLVRKRSESANASTYYFKDQAGFEYFKVDVPLGTAASSGGFDAIAVKFHVCQAFTIFFLRCGLI